VNPAAGLGLRIDLRKALIDGPTWGAGTYRVQYIARDLPVIRIKNGQEGEIITAGTIASNEVLFKITTTQPVWGDIAGGYAIRLRPAKPLLKSDQWPGFLVDFRNATKRKIEVVFAPKSIRFEFDGVWYRPIAGNMPVFSAGPGNVPVFTVGPGEDHLNVPFRPSAKWAWLSPGGNPLAIIPPGKHKFRLAFSGLPKGDPGGKTIEVISELLEVSIPQPATQHAGGGLEFRIALSRSDLGKAELTSYMKWLKDGKVGFWWRDGRVAGIAGRMPEHAWLPCVGEQPNTGTLVFGAYRKQMYILVSDKPGRIMLRGKGKDAWKPARAYAMKDSSGLPAVGFELDDRGAEMFATLTKDNIRNTLAILVDGKVVSTPMLMSSLGKRGVITGQFTEKQAADIARAISPGR